MVSSSIVMTCRGNAPEAVEGDVKVLRYFRWVCIAYYGYALPRSLFGGGLSGYGGTMCEDGDVRWRSGRRSANRLIAVLWIVAECIHDGIGMTR
jgi:hypothetical protein